MLKVSDCVGLWKIINLICVGAIIYTNSEFGVGNGPVIYGNVECFGHENYIADCPKVVAPNFNCYSYAGVGILCRDSKFNMMV